jgi:hypothetical protein
MSKHALVIACDYKGSNIQLNGCEVDGSRMSVFFAQQGFSVKLMSATQARNDPKLAPNKTNIIAELFALGKIAGIRSIGIFFAGHGTQVPSSERGEIDGRDECLVCQHSSGPSAMPGRADLILDNELLSILRTAFGHLDVDVFCMFDACHSGTVCDLGHMLGRDAKWTRNALNFSCSASDKFRLVCFSGADDSESALEAGSGGGLMTNKFLRCVTRGDLKLSSFCAEFATMGFQTPQISAAQPTSLDTTFGGVIVRDGQARPGSVAAAATATVIARRKNRK